MALTAFWIALAAVLIASHWRNKHTEAMRHETIRLLLQTKGDVALAEIKELLHPPRPLPASLPPCYPCVTYPPPGRYKAMRTGGSILMIASLGVGAMIGGIGVAQNQPQSIVAAIGVALCIFLIGAGVFFASRFWAPRDGQQAA
jgi:hypothetical protein